MIIKVPPWSKSQRPTQENNQEKNESGVVGCWVCPKGEERNNGHGTFKLMRTKEFAQTLQNGFKHSCVLITNFNILSKPTWFMLHSSD
jgi:hypothetical protein